MANYTECPFCGTEVSKSARKCAFCGAKLKGPFYKRGWFVLLVLVCLLGGLGYLGKQYLELDYVKLAKQGAAWIHNVIVSEAPADNADTPAPAEQPTENETPAPPAEEVPAAVTPDEGTETEPTETEPADGTEEEPTETEPTDGTEEELTETEPADGTEEELTETQPTDGTEEELTETQPADGTEEELTETEPADGTEEEPTETEPADGTEGTETEEPDPADEPGVTEPDEAESSDGVVVCTAADITRTYENNLLAGNLNYRGKVCRVSGTIKSFGEMGDQAYVILNGWDAGSLVGVRCFVDSLEDIQQLAAMEKGQELTMEGVCVGLGVNVDLENARIAGDAAATETEPAVEVAAPVEEEAETVPVEEETAPAEAAL